MLTIVLLTVAALISATNVAHGFNLDIDSALVHRGPLGTYFGFSVTQHRDGRNPWLLVGAPLAQTEQPGVDHGGAVYKCSVYNPNSCRQIDFDRTGSGSVMIRGRQEQTDEKSGQWFGATVHSAGEAGIILACAPRYTYFSQNRRRREPVGSCFISRGSFTGFMEYSPCRTPNSWGYHKQGSCQAGFSAALTSNGQRMYIGAPGSWYWQGQVFSQDMVIEPRVKNEPESPLGTKESSEADDDCYLGYSLTTGEFNSDGSEDVAVGMPKGLNLTGKVVIYTASLANVFNISGEQMGSYFGHSLASGDFNGDGLDDLAIGAPLFTPSTKDISYEKGRVYIAYQTAQHTFEIKTRIDGTANRGRFGLSLTSIGDLNKDGFNDLVVGAPYDGKNGAGAVYIYNGARNGLRTTPSQVIYAEDLNEQGLTTFGYSLSGGGDLDHNEYPDLLIGAYASDRAVQLKGRPVVDVEATLKVDPENINLLDKAGCALTDGTAVHCVLVSVCLQYTGHGVPKNLNFTYNIRLDADRKGPPRMFLLYEENETEDEVLVLLQKDSKYCKSIYVYLNTKLRDKLTPIKIELEYNVFDAWPHIKAVKPILNKEVKNVIAKNVQIAKNCGKDNRCIPDLNVNVNSNMDQYLIGSKKRLRLNISVENRGEDAFEAMLYLQMPVDINFVRIDKDRLSYPICTGAQPDKTGRNELVCDIGNPMSAGRKVDFAVILEPSSMTSAAPDFTFITTVNSSNPQDKPLEPVVVGIPIRVEVNMTLNGVSNPSLLIYNYTEPIARLKSSELDIGPQVVHLYQVQNRGPSTIKSASVTILWPSQTTDRQHLLYLLDQPLVAGKGHCHTVTLDEVNPLRLPIVKDSKDHYLNTVLSDSSTLLARQNHSYEVLTRTKRLYSPNKGRPDLDDGVLEEYLSCGPRMCTRIHCTVNNLAKGDSVLFTVRSRLWKETVVDIASSEFAISSKIVAIITELPYDVNPKYLPPEVTLVTTQIHTVGLEKPAPVPLWIIILAVVGGLLLLSLLALALYKCGFFKRKRPPIVASDAEPLSPSRNGSHNTHYKYNWTKGDTSL